jgi:molybdenum cofactor cytidylyltransferase
VIAAIVLAAGLSRRMGRPKLNLPWGETTVIEKVIETLHGGGAGQVVVVTGGAQAEVEPLASALGAQTVFNPRYAEDKMIFSLQVGLRNLEPEAEACLVALGDQPQIELEVVRRIVKAYRQTGGQLIVPSYQMRRGHPWLVGRANYSALLDLQPPATLRDFLEAHAAYITYLVVETPSILQDVDTPEDYDSQRPRGKH